jgi:hypothetical protein
MNEEALARHLAQLSIEIQRLTGETLALQAVLVQLAGIAASRDTATRAKIATAFDEAAGSLEDLTIKAGSTVSPDHFAHALRVVEELRATALGHHDKAEKRYLNRWSYFLKSK